jgi:hypothetical protein
MFFLYFSHSISLPPTIISLSETRMEEGKERVKERRENGERREV